MKYCSNCNSFKELKSFGKDKWRSDGLTSRCKGCRNILSNIYRKNNPDIVKKINDASKIRRKEYYDRPENKLKFRNLAYKRTFGITLADYDKMFSTQKGKCAICKTSDPKVTRRANGYVQNFSVDHCHKTGTVRGLLCGHCNRGLGSFKDNRKFLLSALKYLERNL